jgi:YadA-like C-terminal region.
LENAYKTERQNYADLAELHNILYDLPKKKEEVAGLKSNMEQLKTAANPNQAKIDNATKSYETAKNELVSIWKGTAGSVSVGNEIRGITRQITGVAAGTTYRGQSAVAVGVSYTPKPNMVISLSGSADTNNGVGAATGVSFGF